MSYFTKAETSCKCTCGMDIDPTLRDRLDELRARFGAPLSLTSGARCSRHNAAVGGAPASQHVQGKAVDISTVGMKQADRFRLVKLAIEMGVFTGVGINNMFIHLDIGHKEPTIWSY